MARPIIPDNNTTKPLTDEFLRDGGPASAFLVVIRGQDLGARVLLTANAVIIGRGLDCDYRIDDANVSRRHCMLRLEDGQWHVRDLESTNGTTVNGNTIGERALEHGDSLSLGGVVLKFIGGETVEARYHQQIYDLASFDALTGLLNRRRFREALDQQVATALERPAPLSLLFLDLDHFKSINDRFGHACGDEVLRCVAKILAEQIGAAGTVGRLGGEEFGAFLADADLARAAAKAEAVRAAVADELIAACGRQVTLTVSLGVAQWSREMENSAGLMRAADGELYRAKRSGRNRVAAADGLSPPAPQ